MDMVLAFVTAAGLTGPAPDCLQALQPLAAGDIAFAQAFAPAECPAEKPAPAFRYDRARAAMRLARDIVPSEVVSAYPDFRTDAVAPGQVVKLQSLSGAVRIERDAEAMQSARPGQQLFVRTREGDILSARYEGLAP